ncbi:MAG: type II CRISPR RNA-guided endonuclease Cas9 [Planctomycetota bacterium]|nr:type II CRISPR RNA-guided endonuclease Cas9 [Planctomycetota bacterium]
MSTNETRWRLGLDIGSSSVGWAALSLDEAGNPNGVLGMGVRIFAAGTDGDIKSGKDESRSVKRRGARMQRRQLERRARRSRNLFNELRRLGLLPGTGLAESDDMHATIDALDAQLRVKWVPGGDHRKAQLLPYLLRAAAAERALEPHEVGRALFHLAQRRGFQSNRKESTKPEEDKELGPVKKGIATLQSAIGSMTLGQYFATLDPNEHRIRSRWTARQMYRDEFDRIQAAQATGPAALESEAWKRLAKRIFHQRPLKSQKGKVGRCEFIKEDRRAPKWLPEFQRYRLLAAVNNLRVRTAVAEGEALGKDTRRGFVERPLSEAERTRAIQLLEAGASVKLTALRKALKLQGTTFNLEEGGEKELKGDVTVARLRKVFGDQWDTMTEVNRRRVLTDVLSMERDEALARRGREVWGLNDEAVHDFVHLRLEEGYASLGRLALQRLLPHMERGLTVQEARKEAFPSHFEADDRTHSLPPVRKSLYHLRNPTVERSLTETRRVANELIREFGVPQTIHVELARDIKKSRKDRQEIAKKNRNRQGERETVAEKLSELGIGAPSRSDIEKGLLHEECGGKCPYTGRSIALTDLFSTSSPWDVEHIIPFSRSLDDSFWNKTLCWGEENRNRKGNRTPYEAYAPNATAYEQMLSRVEQFQGKDKSEKLRRFKMRDVGDDLKEEFCSRQLNDTKYASRLACGYLEELYGGAWDEDGTRRIFASAGGVTAMVRRELGIQGMLHPAGAPTKTRDDHRHHGLDALAIALTSPGMVKQLSDSSEQAREAGRRRFKPIPAPWVTFSDEVIAKVDEMVVSHRGNRSLAGELHEATNYSRAIGGDDGERHVRKPLSSFAMGGKLDDIVDPVVRKVVQDHVAAKGGDKKCLANAEDPPRMPGRDGQPGTPIRRVRIKASRGTIVPVGQGSRQRYVAPGSNHHMAVVAILGKDGTPVKWEGHVVTRLEAVRRAAKGEPVIQRDWGAGKKFCFSLSSGDMVRMTIDGKDGLYVVRGVTEGQVEFTTANEARPIAVIRKEKFRRYRFSPSTLMRECHTKRVAVSAGGQFSICNA